MENIKELKRVINEIVEEKDYTQIGYEDIRYCLRPFEYLPLQINTKSFSFS